MFFLCNFWVRIRQVLHAVDTVGWLQWDLLVNGTMVGQLLPSPINSVLEDVSGLSVTSAQRTRMNVLGTVFPFPKNVTTQEGSNGRTVTKSMQHQVKMEAQVTMRGMIRSISCTGPVCAPAS